VKNKIGFYYKVSDKIFYNKIDAITYASKTMADISWHFHEDVFNLLDWTIEPLTPLDEFYRIRAKQIREKYDYVVILCSGGADSTNVVKSFLNNGIKPDEIIAAAPMKGLNNFSYSTDKSEHHNTMSETKYAQLPLMNEISQNFPEIKITLHDYFDDILEYESEEWLYRCEDWVHPSSLARYRYERIPHLKNIAESGKSLAFVYGIDKPTLTIDDSTSDIYTIFADLPVNVQRPAFDREYQNVDNVLFYWSDEFPQMLIKQAHELSRWIFKPENINALRYLRVESRVQQSSWPENRLRHSRYERSIVPCIYPSTHRPIFQAEKPTKLFLGEHDSWFYQLHNKTMSYQMIVSDTISFFKKIPPKYVNPGRNGFKTYTNYYKIGKLKDFTTDIKILEKISNIPESFMPFYFDI
jgi:hypothetical protein